jgi:TolB-like protein
MQTTNAKVFCFDGFTLDLRRGCLRQGDSEIKLRPKSFAILCYLAENAGRLVAKDELVEAIWPGVIVTDESLTRCISDVRLAFGDAGQQIIRTVPRRGYLLAVPVSESARLRPSMTVPEGLPHSALALPDKPSIAVLPFTNLMGVSEQQYFVDGMVEEIITALSRIHWLFVIARSSSFTYRGRALDVKQIGRELGVRYILDGSVRKAGPRVRIAAQLIDATTGTHLWADRFEGSLEDVFELQDKVASNVAGVIEPALQAAEAARSGVRPTDDQTAYDLYLRAYAMTVASSASIPEAFRLMEQAIERDPRYGPALAWAAVCCTRLIRENRSADREADRRRAGAFARRALEAANDDPAILVNAAYALAYLGEDIDATLALIDRALTLNPSFARGWHVSGVVRIWAGQLDLAIEHATAGLRLSPRARLGASLNVIATGHFYRRCFDEALPNFLLAIQEDPSYPQAYRGLASCYAYMGRLDEAREIVRRLRTIVPIIMPDLSHLRNAEHREIGLSGLRLAASEDFGSLERQ